MTLRTDHAKSLDVLTSLPVSHAILPHAVCFATSYPANHAICSFIDSSGYASGPIRICLFIDYIIITLKVPITTAAEGKCLHIFPNFQKKKGMIFHENRLLADNSHEISNLICYS